MKNKRLISNIVAAVLAVALVVVVIIGIGIEKNSIHTSLSDGIEPTDLDTIKLEHKNTEVSFSDVIISNDKESRKLIVLERSGTVTTELTERLIQKLDFDFLKKTQNVSYKGTGYFVVDLDNLTSDSVIEDKDKKTITIRIDHAYLQAIEINPNNIIIDEVKQGLLARGDIELSLRDYNSIEKELRTRLETKFNTVLNGQTADDTALKMVKEIYEPIVTAIDKRYSVIVEFK